MKFKLFLHTIPGESAGLAHFDTKSFVRLFTNPIKNSPSVFAFVIACGKFASWQRCKLAGRGLERSSLS